VLCTVVVTCGSCLAAVVSIDRCDEDDVIARGFRLLSRGEKRENRENTELIMYDI
jgi:hypothetical protein